MNGQANIASTQYDAAALRVESSWGKRLLVRGADGTVVGNIGSRGVDLTAAVASSPNAVREAREFDRHIGKGWTILSIGIVAWGVGGGVARMDGIDPIVSAAAWSGVAAGTAMIFYGGVRLNKAFTALSRSIWWYNRDLVANPK
jgi:hypothetical protein